MSWLVFATFAYFLASLVLVLDKIILAKPIPKPSLYASYVGLVGIYALALMPFGFSFSMPLWAALLSVASGFIFILSLIFYYKAARLDEIGRVGPLSGTLTAVFTLLLSSLFLIEILNTLSVLAFLFLVAGGWLIAFRKSDAKFSFRILLLSSAGSFLLAVSWVLIKTAYSGAGFLNAYILGRLGEFAAGLFLFALPNVRRDIYEHLKGIEIKTIGLFAGNKIVAAAYFILLNYAVFLGSVSLVQGAQGLQYVFLLFLTVLLTLKRPDILKEELTKRIIFRKTFAIILIVAGLFILALIQKPADLAPGARSWGVSFSKPFAEKMVADWRAAYLAILDDLKVRRLRLIAYWPEIEKSEGVFSFEDLDWQIEEAEKRGAKVILAVGQKLPRWPECHIPQWVREFPISNSQFLNKDFENALLNYIKNVILRYKDNPAIWAWQVENEPFLPFGECPPMDVDLLDKEITLVKSLDNRPIIVSDSGELSAWVSAARRADIFGTTMYRVVWHKNMPFGGYLKYPLPPEFFHLKANFAGYFADIKRIIVVELQAEPWGPKLLYESSLEEQMKSMNFEQLKENIAYAKTAGFSENYFWGAEWWYWMKEKQNHPEFWNYAKELFIENLR